MERLEDYIAFDLEFNQHEGRIYLIQVSAVRFRDGQEIDAYDSYVHTNVPLKSFINGLTGITAETLKDAPPVEEVIKEFQDFVGTLPMVGYNAAKSDLPILAEHGLDYSPQYKWIYMMKLLNVAVQIYMVLPISNCKPLPRFLDFKVNLIIAWRMLV